MRFPFFSRPLPARGIAATALLGVTLSLVSVTTATAAPAAASDTQAEVSLGPDKQERTYIVQLDEAPVPSRGEGRSRQNTPSAKAWRSELKADQRETRGAIDELLDTSAPIGRTWTDAINGFAVTLTGNEARKVATLPGVKAVTVDERWTPDALANGTDEIAADQIWDGTASAGVSAKGEGLVIGIIDSGINPANPSFATTVSEADGGDGYVVHNPLGTGKYLGMCDPENKTQYRAAFTCTDKLIGAWDFSTDTPDPTDTDDLPLYDNSGHGSHTASIAAGNQVRATWPGTDVLPNTGITSDPNSGQTTVISGVAPHANLISYDVCAASCSIVDSVAAWEQAIRDGVDVINFSVGSNSLSDVTSPWASPIAQAQLSARAKGISVAQSAGNNGNRINGTEGAANTLTNNGDTPWATSVANTSHSLASTNGSVTFTSTAGGTAYVGPFSTGTISGNLPSATEVVRAADVDTPANPANDGLCMPGDLPSAAVAGKIVLCKRGNNDRVNKGRVVKDAGGVGMLLVNTSTTQDFPHDIHVLPTAHLTSQQGTTLASAMGSFPGLKASIVGGTFTTNAASSDVLKSGSSRGPTRNNAYAMGPMLSAPGTDVLAAGGTNNASQYAVMSGTSMAAPAVAGSMALLKQVHPTWTDAEITSALMTTANAAVKDFDGTPATWFEMGSGRIDLARASQAGLLLDVPNDDWAAANPALGGDLSAVNTAQINDGSCAATCASTRTFTATDTGLGTWTASVTSNSPEATFALDASSFTMTQVGQTQAVTVTTTLTSTDQASNFTGTLTLTPPPGSAAPQAHLPIVVRPLTPTVNLNDASSPRAAGSVGGSAILPFPADQATWTVAQPTAGALETFTAAQDATETDPYDANSGALRVIQVPAGTKALAVAIDRTTAPDIDLYVGTGSTATSASQQCVSAVEGSAEQCVIDNPTPGPWWILVQNFESSVSGSDPVTLDTALVAAGAPAPHLSVVPVAPIKTPGKAQRLALRWNAPLAKVGSSNWTIVTASHDGVVAEDVVRLRQHPTDVAFAALPTQIKATDTLRPRITVQPDSAATGAVHTVTVAVPVGVAAITRVTGNGQVRATATGALVTWSGTHAQLAAAAGVAANGSVNLTMDVKVGSDLVGKTVRFGYTESVDTPGTQPTSRTDAVVVRALASTAVAKKRVTITAKTQGAVRKGKKAKPVLVTVKATGAKPRGRVTITLKGAGRTITKKAAVPANGRVLVALGKYRKVGKVSVKVAYAGDATTLARTVTTSFKVKK